MHVFPKYDLPPYAKRKIWMVCDPLPHTDFMILEQRCVCMGHGYQDGEKKNCHKFRKFEVDIGIERQAEMICWFKTNP